MNEFSYEIKFFSYESEEIVKIQFSLFPFISHRPAIGKLDGQISNLKQYQSDFNYTLNYFCKICNYKNFELFPDADFVLILPSSHMNICYCKYLFCLNKNFCVLCSLGMSLKINFNKFSTNQRQLLSILSIHQGSKFCRQT